MGPRGRDVEVRRLLNTALPGAPLTSIVGAFTRPRFAAPKILPARKSVPCQQGGAGGTRTTISVSCDSTRPYACAPNKLHFRQIAVKTVYQA